MTLGIIAHSPQAIRRFISYAISFTLGKQPKKFDPKEEPFEKTTQVFANCHRRNFPDSRLRPQFKVRNGNGEHDECYRNPRRDDGVARKFSYDATYQR
jgi:hypothetical protein